jgi:phage terminase large subunit GpA-like protein
VSRDVQAPAALTVSQWADKYRQLPATSAEPGQWRTDRVPYLRGVMDALGDESIRRVLFMKSAQVGGTSCGENWLGWLIDVAPCGILMLWPTEKKIRSWSRKKLTPLVRETAPLAAKFPDSGRRDSGNTIASKEFDDGFLQMLSAKSTSDLRSTDAKVGIVEEADEIDAELKGQGDPIGQFDARFRAFWNSKLYMVSTPTLEGFSRTDDEWKLSTQHHYYVPCPHCDCMQQLRWRDGKDDQDEAGAYRLIWEEDENGEVVVGSAQYLCEDCGALIPEHHKMAMLLAGEWRATYPGRETVGFHINTLYSPLTSWTEVAKAFKKAKKSPATMQTFVNLWLGLPYREPGAHVDAGFLASRAEPYELGTAPHGVALLTAGVDVQGDRLAFAVWGWGAFESSWLVAWDEVTGDLSDPDFWEEFDRSVLRATWKHVSGAPMKIEATCIDANYNSDEVHKFTLPRFARHVIPVIGRDGRGRKLIEPPRKDRWKRTSRERNPSYLIGTDTAKDTLLLRLKITEKLTDAGVREYPGGFVHFPENVDPVFYDQLTAERLATIYRDNRPLRVWKQIEGRRNEALDITVYAMGAFKFLTMGNAPKVKLSDLAARAQALSDWQPPEPPKEGETPEPAPSKPSGWGPRQSFRKR